MFSVVAAESWTPFWVCGGGVRTLQSEPIHADGLGSVVRLTDSNGNVVHSYQYDAWGNIEAETGAPVDGVQYTFTGREWDPETGLYYYRARYLDPKVGRFISEDPIGFAGGDPDLYAYVWNRPTAFIDPPGTVAVAGKVAVNVATGAAFGAGGGWLGAKIHNWAQPNDPQDVGQVAVWGAEGGAIGGLISTVSPTGGAFVSSAYSQWKTCSAPKPYEDFSFWANTAIGTA
ncbi:MAG: hypothetical protein MUF10_16440, partial [Thermoanaerobaculaceae bacterium]|nr:hypothetical protein [Thermoanaerobaculaceae bacterium]